MANPQVGRGLAVRTGVNLVKLADFSRSLELGGETFWARVPTLVVFEDRHCLLHRQIADGVVRDDLSDQAPSEASQ